MQLSVQAGQILSDSAKLGFGFWVLGFCFDDVWRENQKGKLKVVVVVVVDSMVTSMLLMYVVEM